MRTEIAAFAEALDLAAEFGIGTLEDVNDQLVELRYGNYPDLTREIVGELRRRYEARAEGHAAEGEVLGVLAARLSEVASW